MTTPPHFGAVALRHDSGCVQLTMGDGNTPFSLTTQSVRDLLDAVRWARSCDTHVLVLRGGERSWCVGGDIREFARADDLGVHLEDVAEVLHRVISELTRSDMIVVAAVAGVAAGAGMPLAAAADIVVASEHARFTLGHGKLGLSPDGGTSLLPSTLGLHRTLFIALTNPMLTAVEAREAGLVSIVAPADSFESELAALVTSLLAGSASAQAAAKHLVRSRVAPDAEALLRRESLALRDAAGHSDATEGIAAFLDKRTPVFP
jgi:2-(1,2-epoxy-1,2-dihydrophenyl)acetyl-CoA isomerase